jgi:hypothetical protein
VHNVGEYMGVFSRVRHPNFKIFYVIKWGHAFLAESDF